MIRRRDMGSLYGLMGEATRGNGRMESKMEGEFLKTRKESRKLEFGVMAKRLDGSIDFY
jgi:hypothetical protein